MNAALALDAGPAMHMHWRGVPASLKAHECMPCSSGPSGKEGHGALRYVMFASEMDRTFFRCGECGERWMRSAGIACRFVWRRYKFEAAA